MTQAIRRLYGLGWLALVFMVLLLLYPLSLRVATVRSDLMAVDAAIVEERRQISYLEANLSAYANRENMQIWNEVEYGYEAPGPRQYLEGERALAQLGGGVDARAPVLVSVAESLGGIEPKGVIGSKIPTFEDAPDRSAKADVSGSGNVTEAKRDSGDDDKGRNETGGRTKSNARTRMAEMEDKLLSDDTMKDIRRMASAEVSQ